MSNSLVVRVGADISSFKKELKNITKETKVLGDALISSGKYMTTHFTAPLMGIAAASTYVGANFEESMSNIQAVTGATAEELVMLEKTSRDWGKTTVFGAAEVAGAMEAMGLSGWDAMQIYNGLPGVIHLAASAHMDLSAASNIVTNAINAFNMEASEASRVADVLATTNKNANTTVTELGSAFESVAPIAGALGYSIEDTSVALGLMANAGIKGSKAGTALSRALSDLTTPTKDTAKEMDRLGIKMFNADGSARPLEAVLVDLRKSLGGMNEAQQMASASTLFSTSALAGMTAVINASDDDFNKLVKNLADAEGNAETLSAVMQDNLKGNFAEFKSKLEETGIIIYERLAPALSTLVGWLSNAVDWFNNLSPVIQTTIIGFGGVVAAIGPLLIIGGKLLIFKAKLKGSLVTLKAMKTADVAATKAQTVANKVNITSVNAKSVANLKAAGTAKTMTVAMGTKGVAGATATATKSVGLFAKGTLLVKAAPFVAAGAAAYKMGSDIKKSLEKEAIPAMDLFQKEVVKTEDGMITAVHTVSEATQEIVGTFMDMSLGVEKEITTMWASNKEITQEGIDSINAKYDEMSTMVINHIETQKNETLELTRESLQGMHGITAEEQARMLELIEEHHNDQIERQKALDERRREILKTSLDEEGRLTEEGRKALKEIDDEYRLIAIESMTKDATEQKVIMNNLQNSKERINAEMVSDAVKSINEIRNSTVETSEKERDERIRAAEELRRVGGAEAERLADKQIEEANRMYEEVVKSADKQRKEGLDKLKESYGDMSKDIDMDTGKILSNWDKMKNWWNGWKPDKKRFEIQFDSKGNVIPGNNANGTSNWRGGLTWVNERGPELIDLPQGTSIVPAPLSALMSQSYGRELARAQMSHAPVSAFSTSMPSARTSPTNGGSVDALSNVEVTNHFVVDGKTVASVVTPLVGKNLVRAQKREERVR